MRLRNGAVAGAVCQRCGDVTVVCCNNGVTFECCETCGHEQNERKAKMKNECGKTRKISEPYEVWQSIDGTWEWRVLKKYKSPEAEKKDRYARWFCAVKSPFTYDSYEYGDCYVIDIMQYARRAA